MLVRLLIVGVLLAVLFGGIFGYKAQQAREFAAMRAGAAAPAVVVSSTEVAVEQWERQVQTVGALAASQGVRVAAEVPGRVLAIHFRSGASVAAGDLLVELDDSAEQAELRSLQADLELARLDLARARDLRGSAAMSQAMLDRAATLVRSLEARAEQHEVLIARKAIRAPFAGELGIRLVHLGAYLSPGSEVVTLQSLEPIHLDFTVPERYLGALVVGQPVRVPVAAWQDEVFTGEVTAISPELDRTSRTVRLQATFANPDGRLRPGMFAQVAVVIGEPATVLTLPRTAIAYQAYGETVFLIEAGADGSLVAERRPVRVGRVRDGRVEVLDGVGAGQQVVNTGQMKLRSGQLVRIDNDLELPTAMTRR